MSNIDNYRDRPVPDPDGVKKTGMALGEVLKEHPDLEFVNATIGVFHEEHEDGQPEWYQEAGRKADEKMFKIDRKKSGYNFLGDPDFMRSQATLIFGHGIKMEQIEVAPSFGGSDAIKTVNGVVQGLVPIIVPTWPNHKGLIETSGGVTIPYRVIDDKGDFDDDVLYEMLDPEAVKERARGDIAASLFMQRNGIDQGEFLKHRDIYQRVADQWIENQEVVPLLEAVCKNPYAIDIPERLWPKVAELLVKNNMVVQIDLAYLGFARSLEKDLYFLRYLAERGVKMFVEVSMSKFHSHYSWERSGSIMAVNFDPEDNIKAKLLHRTRNTTSAIASRGQVMSAIIETDNGIKNAQRKTVNGLRENSEYMRNIIKGGLPGSARRFALDTSIGSSGFTIQARGPFLFAPDGEKGSILPYAFPELADKLGVEVPEDARDFPKDKIRVAGVYSPPEDGLGLGGLRLGIAGINRATAIDIRSTLGYAYDHVNQ